MYNLIGNLANCYLKHVAYSSSVKVLCLVNVNTRNTVTCRLCIKTRNIGLSFQVQCEYLSLDSMEKWIICKYNAHS